MKFELTIDKDKSEKVSATVHKRSRFTEQLEQLVLEHNGTDSVTAYTEDDIKILSFNEIECVTVIDGKTYVIASSGSKYKLRQRLYEMAEVLPAAFIKINKSSIANKSRIERFSAGFGGGVDVIFKSGYGDYVSRRCFAEIKKELKTK